MSKSVLKDLQTAYRHTFNDDMSRDVLADLRVFCYATKTTGGKTVSNEEMRELEGRRQVFMRIMQMLKVDVDQFYNLEVKYPDDDF